jgi:hypothetical protein
MILSREIRDRRRRAWEAHREAYRKARRDGTYETDQPTSPEWAIEVATRVKITPEMIQAVAHAGQIAYLWEAERAIKAFCAAAGFEVIK